jgi:hypothetical protein
MLGKAPALLCLCACEATDVPDGDAAISFASTIELERYLPPSCAKGRDHVQSAALAGTSAPAKRTRTLSREGLWQDVAGGMFGGSPRREHHAVFFRPLRGTATKESSLAGYDIHGRWTRGTSSDAHVSGCQGNWVRGGKALVLNLSTVRESLCFST